MNNLTKVSRKLSIFFFFLRLSWNSLCSSHWPQTWGDPPTSVFLDAGIICLSHHAQPHLFSISGKGGLKTKDNRTLLYSGRQPCSHHSTMLPLCPSSDCPMCKKRETCSDSLLRINYEGLGGPESLTNIPRSGCDGFRPGSAAFWRPSLLKE